MPTHVLRRIRLLQSGLLCLLALVGLASTAHAEDKTRIEFIKAGAAPYEVMNYAPTAGVKQNTIMSMRMNNDVSVGGQAQPAQAMPGFEFTMTARAAAGPTGGTRSITAVFEGIKVLSDNAEMAAIIQPMMDMLKGMTMAYDVAPNGVATNVKITGGADSPMAETVKSQIRKQVTQMSTPLPTEPIGIGGVWKLYQTVENDGLVLKQVVTYTVVAREGSQYKLNMTVAQTADPQEIKNPALPAGATMKLEKMVGTATGEQLIDLLRPLPLKLEMKVVVDLDSVVIMDDETQAVIVKTTVDMTMVSRDGDVVTPTAPVSPVVPATPATPTDTTSEDSTTEALKPKSSESSVRAELAATRTKMQLRHIGDAISNFKLVNRRLPSSLAELTEKPEGSDLGYLDKVPTDPWGNAYTYKLTGAGAYEVRSAGPDGKPETADDVTSAVK